MKNLLFILVLLSVLIIPTGGSIYAQIRVKADIPFAFTVVNEPLPAGSYAVARHSIAPAILVEALERADARALAATNSVEANPGLAVDPKLVFRRYGEQYFLAEVWLGAGNFIGRQIPKSVKERQVAKNSSEPELIYVAAR